jgi:hypothetical protein
VKRELPPGARVHVSHARHYSGFLVAMRELRKIRGSTGKVSPRGGWTEVRVLLPDGTLVRGTALCSEKDNFSKKIGRDIALGRALKQLEAR